MSRSLSVVLLLVLVRSVAAQQPTDTATLAPVVVTATLVPVPANALSSAVTVLEGAELRREGIRTVGEALRAVPAADVVTNGGSYGSVTSLFLRGGEPGYVKVLIDGVPQVPPGGPGQGYDFANLTTDDIERIEVVRGPVSVLYGSDAVTGVVQIFTKSGNASPHPQLSVVGGGGTYSNSDLAVTLSGGGSVGDYNLNVEHVASDGVYALNNDYRNEAVNGRLRVHPDSRTDAALAFRYDDALYHFPTDGSGAVVSNNQHQWSRGPSLGVDLTRRFSAAVEGVLDAGWARENYLYSILPNDATDTLTFPYASSDWMTRENIDARTNIHVKESNIITAGAVLEHEAMAGTTLDTSRGRDNRAVYAQLLTGVNRPLAFTFGARLDDNDEFGAWGTYRAGGSLRVARLTRLVGSVGTGFKEPTFYQNFATGFVRGNPDLKPEHSLSWELGIEQTIPGTQVRGRATYFDQRFRDLIDYNGAASGANYFNVPGANVSGLELTLDAPLGSALHVAGTYTRLDAKVTESGSSTGPTALYVVGQPLIRRPDNSGSMSVSWRRGTALTALTGTYVGPRADVDFGSFTRVTLPAYWRWDASLSVAVVNARGTTPGLAARFRVENLFDQAYEEVKNFPARRRTLFAGAEVQLGY